MPLPTKLLFWIILAAFSSFFAEVVSGSEMFPFSKLWGIIAIIPLYGLHILLLAHVVYHYGRPRLYTLSLAGGIFGLYEAYISKVLWDPFWGPSLLKIGGVAVWEIMLLVFFWHAFMSFIIPLVLCESMLTSSSDSLSGLPGRARVLLHKGRGTYLLFVFFALIFGLIQSVNSKSPLDSLLSGTTSAAVLLSLVFIWKWLGGASYTMKELLPGKKAFRALLPLTLLFYAIMAFILRPEALPGLYPQAAIWALYAVFFVLLYLSLRKSRRTGLSQERGIAVAFSWRFAIVLFVAFTLASALSEQFLSGFGDYWVILLFIGGAIFGLIVFVFAAIDALRR